MYGASTTEGIAWQFRGLKKDAEALRTAANNGQKADLNLSTPKGRGGSATKRKTAQPRSSAKRQKMVPSSDDMANDQEDDDIDFDAMDDTPSKSRIKKEESEGARARPSGTPSRRATSAAAAAIKGQSIDLTSEDEAVTPPTFNDEPLPLKNEFASIFGPDAQIPRPAMQKTAPVGIQSQPSTTTDFDFDEFLQARPAGAIDNDDLLDGEI